MTPHRTIAAAWLLCMMAACSACEGKKAAPTEAATNGAKNAEKNAARSPERRPNQRVQEVDDKRVKPLGRRGVITIAGRAHGPTFRVEIAVSEAERNRGLMFRRSMDEDAGMVFFMPGDRDWAFYMRNTYIPLDLVFLDRDWRVVGVLANVPPLTETLRQSGKAGRYVLELNAHVAARHGIRPGAVLQLREDTL